LAQLARKRTALGLYSLLLVLPTLVLGGLHWRQLRSEQSAELNAIPVQAEEAGRRLVRGIRQRLDYLLDAENARPFHVYQEHIYPKGLMGPNLNFVPSELKTDKPPDGVLGWFEWDFPDGVDANYELFGGAREGLEDWESEEMEFADTVEELIEHDWLDGFPKRITRYFNLELSEVALSFAVVNLTEETDFECLLNEEPVLRKFDDLFVEIFKYDFHVRFYLEDDGSPRLIATRLIMVEGEPTLRHMPNCYANLANGATFIQGFFIDPNWFFGELPMELAAQLFRGNETFHPAGSDRLAQTTEQVVERIFPVDALEFETYEPRDANYGALQISISTAEIRERHRRQTRGFLAVALMLLLSLATGMGLLLRSVRRDLDQARRTENFVAAVTHELRTPVSAIRLYGEMLRDGWAASEEKQSEYYVRIVGEAHRLETMVERVLEKSQISSVEVQPQPGDANTFIREFLDRDQKAAFDVRSELDVDLPPVMMTPEALRSILTNLIENARKYAPPGGDVGRDERILVRTGVEAGRPRLEVLDRGPGIPDDEKRSVFEAFYRRGDEATRRSRGTGLGLHLVMVQAQSIGGDVEILDRPHGGSIFRVYLRRAQA